MSNDNVTRGFRMPGFKFSAALLEMGQSEIMAMVPADKLKEIKASDPHPLFKAFVVGHTGTSTGYLVGVGNVVKRWIKEMIQALGKKIKAGIQLFHGHGPDNSTEGRTPIGEVVSSKNQDIDGRESVVVACHIFNSFRHLPLDVASVETTVDYTQNADGSLDIVSVDDVTAVALSSSQIDKPGFPYATLLGQIQAFELKIKKENESRLKLGYSENTGQLPKLKLA